MSERELLQVLLERVEQVDAKLDRVLGDRGPQGLVDADWVAKRYGVKAAWVRRNKAKLGAIPLQPGERPRLRFDPEVVQKAMDGVGPTVKPPRAPARRRRHSQDRSNLLPIARTAGAR